MEKTPKINAEGEVQMGLISQTAEPSSATGVSSSIYKYSAHLEEKKTHQYFDGLFFLYGNATSM